VGTTKGAFVKILVTGSNGQLGLALQRQSGGHRLVGLPREDLDITNAAQVAEVFAREQPAVVINCAGWTDVDGCEGDHEKALSVNGSAVGTLAHEASNVSAQLVQISTDYVFDGTKKEPYTEIDRPNPLSIYGKSKLSGESLAGPSALIVRTSWLMGPDAPNMLQTVLGLLDGSGNLTFVDDQTGCPTFVDDLAAGLLHLVAAKSTGIFHLTNAGPVSWFQFAQEVAELVGVNPARVVPILTTDLSPIRPACRPTYSTLSNQKYNNEGFTPLSDHSEPLRELLNAKGRFANG
jgi:dTDP-4-dehydrorhamnose reductase